MLLRQGRERRETDSFISMHGALFVYGETRNRRPRRKGAAQRLTRPAVRPSLPLLTKGDTET